MTDTLGDLTRAAREWVGEAQAAGWLLPSDAQGLQAEALAEHASLFTQSGPPLIAAFFGGTGVGKSSLLNRLAGAPLADVGLVRPTSREVTVYLHESFDLVRLPEVFPLDRVRVIRHHSAAQRDIVWVDTPDIDSTDQANHALTQAWLAHLDVVIYVVSPERYRDERGWRTLRQYGACHAWLFVFNQCDRAVPLQVEDFREVLARAGFENPLVVLTDCRQDAPPVPTDDFDALVGHLRHLSDRHHQNLLRQHARRASAETLVTALQHVGERMKRIQALDSVGRRWSVDWGETARVLREGQEWALRGAVESLVRGGEFAPRGLWDEWMQTVYADALERLVCVAGESGWPVPVVRAALATVQAEPAVAAEMRRAINAGLNRSGGRARQVLRRISRQVLYLLPLLTTGWVAARVLGAWQGAGATASVPYLGPDFVVHAGLLVALSAGIPWLVERLLRPDLARLAERALRDGQTQALARLEQEALAPLQQLELGRCGLSARLDDLRAAARHLAAGSESPVAEAALARLWPVRGS